MERPKFRWWGPRGKNTCPSCLNTYDNLLGARGGGGAEDRAPKRGKKNLALQTRKHYSQDTF